MAPELVGALGILGCVVLILGAFIWIHVLGRNSRQPEIDTLEAERDGLRIALTRAVEKASERAKGAAGDIGDALDNADAVASGDLDRVRLGFPDDGTDSASGEPGHPPESAGG